MRVSEGSPYPPSESNISEIPRDLEKEDAIEKLSLLPDPPFQPRCITSSGFRDVAEEPGLPKPTFQHCAYYKLPPDIRRYILIPAFGNRRLHMDISYDYPDMSSELIQPLDKNHCDIVIENMYGDRQRVVDDTKPRSWIWWGSVCHRLPPDLDVSRTGPMTHGDPMVLGLIPVASVKLVTATRGLVQSPQSAVSTNTIIMANEAMIAHLHQLLLPQRLASITSLEISWNLKSRYESGLWSITDDEYFIDEEDSKRISQITSTQFPQLHRLYLSLEHSRQLGPCWGPNAWPAISLHLDNLARVMLSLTEHAISLPDTPFDSIFTVSHRHLNLKGKGYWILNGSNWPEKEKLVIGPPPMGEIMGLSPHDFDDFEFVHPLEDI
ncbi:hypothetical protein H9L39_06434 [Fusarium oxysporum f. sp. albedinis]|nr:hypothetical protein H9L39_06434 [Fusarium oxysporum f. sp. albedinis]